MKTKLASCPIFLAFALVAACSPTEETVRGSGVLVDEARSVSAFESVALEDGLSATIALGEPSLVVAIDDNLLPLVRTEVAGSELRLGATAEDTTLAPTAGARVRVRTPTLRRLEASGTSIGEAELRGEDLSVEGAGSVRLDVAITAARSFTTDLSGDSRLVLRGAAPSLSVEASGSSSLASTAESDEVRVLASGSSRITVRAKKRVVIEASGSSEIVVYGHPELRTVDTSGQATVRYAE